MLISGPETARDRQLQKAFAHMDAAALASWLADVLKDKTDSDRYRFAARLLSPLAERMNAEQKRTQARS